MGEYEKISYNNKYNAEKYDRITIMAQKGTKEKLKAHADAHGDGSVNAFILRAISETVEKDNSGNGD